MREDLGYRVKDVSDHEHRELSVKEVLYVFETAYLNHNSPLNIPEAHFVQNADNTITANITLSVNGKETKCSATGNGRLDAVATAIEQQTGVPVITSQNAAQLNQVVSKLIEATSEIPDKNKPKE